MLEPRGVLAEKDTHKNPVTMNTVVTVETDDVDT